MTTALLIFALIAWSFLIYALGGAGEAHARRERAKRYRLKGDTSLSVRHTVGIICSVGWETSGEVSPLEEVKGLLYHYAMLLEEKEK